MPDFDFLYCGRMIRSNDKILEDFINKDNLKLYTNAKGVHGGCFKVPNCSWKLRIKRNKKIKIKKNVFF